MPTGSCEVQAEQLPTTMLTPTARIRSYDAQQSRSRTPAEARVTSSPPTISSPAGARVQTTSRDPLASTRCTGCRPSALSGPQRAARFPLGPWPGQTCRSLRWRPGQNSSPGAHSHTTTLRAACTAYLSVHRRATSLPLFEPVPRSKPGSGAPCPSSRALQVRHQSGSPRPPGSPRRRMCARPARSRAAPGAPGSAPEHANPSAVDRPGAVVRCAHGMGPFRGDRGSRTPSASNSRRPHRESGTLAGRRLVNIGDRDAPDVQFTQICNPVEISGVRVITSLQFCCAGWSLTRGRELSGERPRTLI